LKPVQNEISADILIIHTGALGDIICALKAIECVFSKNWIDFCCQGHIFPVLKVLPNIRNVIDINHSIMRYAFMSEYSSELKDWLKNYQWVLLISFSEEWEKSFSKYDLNIVRIPPRPPIDEIIHTTRFLLDQFHLQTWIPINSSDIQNFILQKKTRSYTTSIDSGGKSIYIHPGSGSSFKNWPIERYILLAKHLQQQNNFVQWILGPAECELKNILIQNDVTSENILQTNKMNRVMHVLSQADHYIGNDSGISHLAAYIGIDTTVIFGPSDFRRWHPIGPFVKTIPDQIPICLPCFEKGIRKCSHKKCLNDITVSKVMTTIENSNFMMNTDSHFLSK